MKNKRNRMMRFIICNVSVTAFLQSLSGMSMFLLFGTIGLAMFVSINKMALKFSSLYASKLIQKYAHLDLYHRMRYSFVSDMVSMGFKCVGTFLVVFGFYYIGFACILIHALSEGFCIAFTGMYRRKINDIFSQDQCERDKFDAEIRFYESMAEVIGLILNGAIYYMASIYKVDLVLLYRIMMVAFGVSIPIDMLISIGERRFVLKELIFK